MTIATSIILAALVGGIVFALIDSWQRRAAEPPDTTWTPERAWMEAPSWRPEVRTHTALPTPEPRTEPLPPEPDRREDDEPPPGLWSGWPGR